MFIGFECRAGVNPFSQDIGSWTENEETNEKPVASKKKKQERDLGIVATQGMWVFRKKGVTLVRSGSFGRGGGRRCVVKGK